MQHGARLRAEHYWEIATRFRLMAEIVMARVFDSRSISCK
jgi:hypothetical protein